MADTEITTGSKRLSLDKNMGTNQMSVELNYICEKIDALINERKRNRSFN